MRLPYFNFSRSERRGIFLLIILAMAIHAAIWFYPPAKPMATVANDTRLQQWLSDISAIDSLNNPGIAISSTIPPPAASTLFYFDPNTLSEEDWVRLGLSAKQARSIQKFRDKGGKFYTPHDLDRVFALRPEQVSALKPWVKIKPNELAPFKTSAAPTITMVELNTADSATLEKLPGIGPALASRIIRYRKQLGGFYDIAQLNEVFGLSAETRQLLIPRLILQTQHIQRIAINTATLNQLGQHPYIRYPLAKLLINYRVQHGPYANEDALNALPFITDSLLLKLKPYLAFE